MAPRTRRLALAGLIALTAALTGCNHTVVFTNRSAEPVTVRGTEPGTLLQMFREDQEKTIVLQPGESAELTVKHGAPIELEGRYALEIK